MNIRDAAMLLGVSENATTEEVTQAFRARARLVHPDFLSENSTEVERQNAARMMSQLNEAKEAFDSKRDNDVALRTLTLRDRVERFGPLPPDKTREFAIALAEALWRNPQSAGGGVLTPARIDMDSGTPLLLDDDGRSGGDATAAWTSPEQVAGERPGPATEVYSWAMCVIYASTGRNSFDAGDTASTSYRVTHQPAEIPPYLDARLTSLLREATRKLPADRPRLSEVVNRLSKDEPAPAPPPGRSRNTMALGIGAAVVVVLLAVVLGAVLFGSGGDGSSTVQSQSTPAPPAAAPSLSPTPVASQPTPPIVTATATATATATVTATATRTRTASATRQEQPSGAAQPAARTGGEAQVVSQLQQGMNSQDWGYVNSLCDPTSVCQSQFTDFFAERFASGQWLSVQFGPLQSCAGAVSGDLAASCTSGSNWVAEVDHTCSKDGSVGVDREVAAFRFAYDSQPRISDFIAGVVLEKGWQCY